jgi:hypothetical protein
MNIITFKEFFNKFPFFDIFFTLSLIKGHFQLEIKILRESPRDEKKLSDIIKVKQEEYEEAQDSEDIERLVPEIEMLKVVLFLVCINGTTKEQEAC